MIPKRAFFFKSIIAITLILSISGCNKTSLDDVNQDGHIGAKTTVSSPNEDGTLRANIPNLFFSYRGDKEGMLNQSSGYLAKTDLLSGVTNFNFHTYGTVPRPYFHKYMPATKELWGIRYGIHLGLSRYMLTKLSVGNNQNTYTDIDIFPQDNLVRKIVEINNSHVYYLEGVYAERGFTRLMRCSAVQGGPNKVVLFEPAIKTEIVAGKINNNKFYYVSKNYAALIELDLITKKSKTLIPYFFLAGATQFDGFKKAVKNNITYLQPQYVTRRIDSRSLSFLDIDFTEGKIFWLTNFTELVKTSNNEAPSVKYNKIRPTLMCANLSGNNITVLDKNFTSVFAEPENGMDSRMLFTGSLQVDPNTKTLYFGLEQIVDSHLTYGPLGNDFTDGHSAFHKFQAVTTNYQGKNIKYLLKSNNEYYNYPVNWNTFSQVKPIYWEGTYSDIFEGSLDSFIFTNVDNGSSN